MTRLTSEIDLWKVVTAVHYAYPVLTLLYFVIASTVAVCTLQTLSLRANDQRSRRHVILWLMGGIVCQYIIQASALLVRSTLQTLWVAPSDEVVYLISSALVWGLQFVTLLDSQFPVWHPYYGNWFATVIVEISLLVVTGVLHRPADSYDFISISISILRVCSFMALLAVYFTARNRKQICENDDAESQPLLRSGSPHRAPTPGESGENPSCYAGMDDLSDDESRKTTDEEQANEDFWFKREQENREKVSKRLTANGNWWAYLKGFYVFFPYIWPINSRTLQFRAILTGLCLLAGNFLNVLVPRQIGVVADALVAGNSTKAWIAVGIYSALTFANSSACFGWLQFWLWQPIEQYSYDTLTSAVHGHVMSLSSEFHESRTASDIQQTINQGRAITDIVDTVCFKIGPTSVDLFLVFAYLYYLFGPYMALDLAATTFFYLYTTTKLVALAGSRRRIYHTHYRKEWSSLVSSINNWRVASYFNKIPYEKSQHRSNIKSQLRSQRAYMTLHNIIRVVQTLVMTLGLLSACFLAAYQVINKTRSPGDFVILISYWAQLRGPLAIFSTVYKDLSENLMDAERMLELFEIKPKVADKDNALPLTLMKGEIVFKEVTFAYDDRKPALNKVNLKINGGSTVAIVGETGSGKSTILKLLHRFYDVKSGSIEIDGHDIRDVTLQSLRENIAVVPQDSTLFSETIMKNLRYARLTASKGEVYEACKAAKIHDKIMSIPDKYKYKVGNTAVKLSGGEQQRISIARAILKQSAIILLDEATSSVDTETEQQIQEALEKLCHGRTTVIVAHRLSTIMRADSIVVMKDGSIIEQGSHDDLLLLKGKYFDLWANQMQLLNPDGKSTNKSDDQTDCKAAKSRSHSPQNGKPNVRSLRSRSNSPQKDKAGIDLDPELNQVELLKLAELYKVTEERTQIVFDVRKTIEHPKLKADAPEFYPRHLRGKKEGTDGSVIGEYKQQAEDRIGLGNYHGKQEEKVQRSYMFLAKSVVKNVGKQSRQLSDIQEPEDDIQKHSCSLTMESSQDSATSGIDNKNERPKLRRPRVSTRRHLSKSEPSGQDGTNDLACQFAGDSGETQPLLGSGHEQNRRASTLSDPVLSQQESHRSSLGGCCRRSRHWRMKIRLGSTSGSASTSAAVSSVDSSLDEGLPNAPTTSPAGILPSANIKFAPGSK